MEISAHCTLCDYKKFDFSTGNLCGITHKKADFTRKCPKIDFNRNAKEEIARINIEYKHIQDQKVNVIGHLILYAIIGIAIILADIYFTKYLYETGWISTMTLIGFGIGLSMIGYAFAPFIQFTNDKSVAKSQKKRVDDLLALYDYDYKINFEEENPEIAVKLFRSKRPI
ncbi:MAG: hypothetical protein AAF617_15465 [Bacteroidota bacterium]